MSEVHVLDHPLIQNKLTRMRRKETNSRDFRTLLKEISMLMAFEVTRNFETKLVEVETPICKGEFPVLKEDFITIVPIIRAGIGLVDGMLELLPTAHVGFIGMERDEETHIPREYYCKARGCKNIRSMNLVAAPEGIAAVQAKHPDVDIYVAAVDECLNEKAYIVPGLGDAGDRIYGTVIG